MEYHGAAQSTVHKHCLRELQYLLLEVCTFPLNCLKALRVFTAIEGQSAFYIPVDMALESD